MFVLGAQKNCFTETVLLSTNNICFGWEIGILFLVYTCHTATLFEITCHGNHIMFERRNITLVHLNAL